MTPLLTDRPRRPRKLEAKARPFKTWPEWGTEHTMTCQRTGCMTCARLAKTEAA
jgi:hypothetical protein